jgi:GWxTD domain-containing protein
VIARCLTRGFLVLLATAPGAYAQADQRLPRDRVANASEAQLDSLYGPLVYLMDQDEQGTYPSLTEREKREFLQRFWARRDPSPGTAKNEAQEQFNARIGTVNRKFSEGRADVVPGWRTDRGRVYLEYGPPDITLTRRGLGFTLPFTVWKYAQGDKQPRKSASWITVRQLCPVYSNDPRAEPVELAPPPGDDGMDALISDQRALVDRHDRARPLPLHSPLDARRGRTRARAGRAGEGPAGINSEDCAPSP